MATEHKAAEMAQGASAALAGALAPNVLGPESMLWVISAMGICSLADVMAPAVTSRLQLATRYLASVAVTLAASYAAAAWVAHECPHWRNELWAVRITAALIAGLFLHGFIATAPQFMRVFWLAVLARVRGSTQGENK